MFLAISIIQEWEVFRSWIMRETGEAALTVDATDRQDAEAAIRSLLSLASHFYGSGGDARFSDRMPAAAWLIEEMQRDVEYLARNGRLQYQSLVRIDFESVERGPHESILVRTKEYWVVRTLFAGSGAQSDPPRSQLIHCSYSLIKDGSNWVVQAWQVEKPAGTVDTDTPPASIEAVEP